MSGRNSLITVFESGDDLLSSCVLFVRCGERAELYSSGWDCNGNDEILVYKVIHYPHNPKCEKPVVTLWTKDVTLDCPLEQVEVPRVKLTKANQHDIIDEHGQYILVRHRDASSVEVFAKYNNVPK